MVRKKNEAFSDALRDAEVSAAAQARRGGAGVMVTDKGLTAFPPFPEEGPSSRLPYDPTTAIPVNADEKGSVLPKYGEITGTIRGANARTINVDKSHQKGAEQVVDSDAKNTDVSFFVWNGRPVLPNDTHDEDGNPIDLTDEQKQENDDHIALFRKFIAQKTGTEQLTAHEMAQRELEDLLENRQRIVGQIKSAREEGDLKENAGYAAARESQSRNEARIKELQNMISSGTATLDENGKLTSTNILSEDDPIAVARRERMARDIALTEANKSAEKSRIGSSFEAIQNQIVAEKDPSLIGDSRKPSRYQEGMPEVPEGIKEAQWGRMWGNLVERHQRIQKLKNDADRASRIVGAEDLEKKLRSEAQYQESSDPISGLRGLFSSQEHFDSVMKAARNLGIQKANQHSELEDQRRPIEPIQPEEGRVFTSPEELLNWEEKAKEKQDKALDRSKKKAMAGLEKIRPGSIAEATAAEEVARRLAQEENIGNRQADLRAQAKLEDKRSKTISKIHTSGEFVNRLQDLPANHPVFDELSSHFDRVDAGEITSDIPEQSHPALRNLIASKMADREALRSEAEARGQAIAARIQGAPETTAKSATTDYSPERLARLYSLRDNLEPMTTRAGIMKSESELDPSKHAYYRAGSLGTYDAGSGIRIDEASLMELPPELEISVQEAKDIRTIGALGPRPDDATMAQTPKRVRTSSTAIPALKAGSSYIEGDTNAEHIIPRNTTITFPHPTLNKDISVDLDEEGNVKPTGDAKADAENKAAYYPWLAGQIQESGRARKVGEFESKYNALRTRIKYPQDHPMAGQEVPESSEIEQTAASIKRRNSTPEVAPSAIYSHLRKTHDALIQHLRDLNDFANQTGLLTDKYGKGFGVSAIRATTPGSDLSADSPLKDPGGQFGGHIRAIQSKIEAAGQHLDTARKIYESSSEGPGVTGINPREANPHLHAAAVALGEAYDHADAPVFDAVPIQKKIDVDSLVNIAKHSAANVIGMPGLRRQGKLPSSFVQGGTRVENVNETLDALKLAEEGKLGTDAIPVWTKGTDASFDDKEPQARAGSAENMPSSKELESSLGNLRTPRYLKSERERFAGSPVFETSSGDAYGGRSRSPRGTSNGTDVGGDSVGRLSTSTEFKLKPGVYEVPHPDNPDQKVRFAVNDAQDVVLPHRETDMNGQPRALTAEQRDQNDVVRRAHQIKVIGDPENPARWGEGQGSLADRRINLPALASTIRVSGGKGLRQGSTVPRGVNLSGGIASTAELGKQEAIRAATTMGLNDHVKILTNESGEHTDQEVGHALMQVHAARIAHMLVGGTDPATGQNIPNIVSPKGSLKQHVNMALKDPEGYLDRTSNQVEETMRPIREQNAAEAQNRSETVARNVRLMGRYGTTDPQRVSELQKIEEVRTQRAKTAADEAEQSRRETLTRLMQKGVAQSKGQNPLDEGAA